MLLRFVMAGLDPAIQGGAAILDARNKSGHDDQDGLSLSLCLCASVVQIPSHPGTGA